MDSLMRKLSKKDNKELEDSTNDRLYKSENKLFYSSKIILHPVTTRESKDDTLLDVSR